MDSNCRWWLLGTVYFATALAAEPFAFEPPAFLRGPSVSRTADGNTYSFRPNSAQDRVALQITVASIPDTLHEPHAKICVDAFVGEIERQGKLFASPAVQPLYLGELPLETWRWIQTRQDALAITGVVGCAIHQREFVAVTFEDSIRNAPHSFPALRKSLALLRFNP